jgi:hypothetical protein
MFNEFTQNNSVSISNIDAVFIKTRDYKDAIKLKLSKNDLSSFEKEQLTLTLFRLQNIHELLKISNKNHFTDPFQIQIYSEIQKNLTELFNIDLNI